MVDTHDNSRKRLSSGGGKKKGLKPNSKGVLKRSQKVESDDDTTMSSFNQFCATCERQIITPDFGLLFCSRQCKNQDFESRANPSVSTNMSPPQTPISENHSFESLCHHPQILQQRSPTSPYPSANRYSISSFSSSDRLDSHDEGRPKVHREPSDATRWLSSFHSSSSLDKASGQEQQSTPRRPKVNRGHSAAPSLSYTASSYSATGMSLPQTPYSAAGRSYSTTAGPLPSRNNPFSPSSYSRKSVDLVQPMAALSMTAPETSIGSLRKAPIAMGSSQDTIVPGEFVDYEKKSVETLRAKKDSIVQEETPKPGSLKHMFAFSAMQSAPSSPTSPSGMRSPRSSRAFIHTHHE